MKLLGTDLSGWWTRDDYVKAPHLCEKGEFGYEPVTFAEVVEEIARHRDAELQDLLEGWELDEYDDAWGDYSDDDDDGYDW